MACASPKLAVYLLTMEKLIKDFKERGDARRWYETLFGAILMAAGVVGTFFFEVNTVITLVLVGLGGVFFSKTKTLEALEKLKSILPGVK